MKCDVHLECYGLQRRFNDTIVMFHEERDEFFMSKLVQVVLDARLSPSVGTRGRVRGSCLPAICLVCVGKHTHEGLMGARRSTGRVSARWFLFPTHTWEPLLLTGVV